MGWWSGVVAGVKLGVWPGVSGSQAEFGLHTLGLGGSMNFTGWFYSVEHIKYLNYPVQRLNIVISHSIHNQWADMTWIKDWLKH